MTRSRATMHVDSSTGNASQSERHFYAALQRRFGRSPDPSRGAPQGSLTRMRGFTRRKRVRRVARVKSNGSGTKGTHTREPAPEQRNFCLWRWPWAYSFPTMPTVTVRDSWNDSQVGPAPLSALHPAESFAEAALRQADRIFRMCDPGCRESDSGCHWGLL